MQYDHFVTGNVIRRLRKQKHMSQEILSGLAGLPRSHLAMIETGQINASVDTLWKIAEAMNIQFSDMMKIVESDIQK